MVWYSLYKPEKRQDIGVCFFWCLSILINLAAVQMDNMTLRLIGTDWLAEILRYDSVNDLDLSATHISSEEIELFSIFSLRVSFQNWQYGFFSTEAAVERVGGEYWVLYPDPEAGEGQSWLQHRHRRDRGAGPLGRLWDNWGEMCGSGEVMIYRVSQKKQPMF